MTFSGNQMATCELGTTALSQTRRQQMSNIVKLPIGEIAIDLKAEDIEAILDCAKSLPGQWGAKIIRVERSKGDRSVNWGYFFRRGPADDISPAISITRTTSHYTVVSWDLLEFSIEGSFIERCANTIEEVLDGARDIVLEFMGIEFMGVQDLGSAQVTESGVST
jgi:hypothetical protein